MSDISDSPIMRELYRDHYRDLHREVWKLEEDIIKQKERMEHLKAMYPNHIFMGREDEIGMKLFHCFTHLSCLESLVESAWIRVKSDKNYELYSLHWNHKE